MGDNRDRNDNAVGPFRPYVGLPEQTGHDGFATHRPWPWRQAAALLALLALLAAGALWLVVRSGSDGPERTSTSASVRYGTVRDVLATMLDAALRGDEATWLAGVDPTQPQLVARMRDLYTNLRALQPTSVNLVGFGLGAVDASAVPTGSVELSLGTASPAPCVRTTVSRTTPTPRSPPGSPAARRACG